MNNLIKLTHPVGQTQHIVYVNPEHILYIDDCSTALRKGCNLIFQGTICFVEESAETVLDLIRQATTPRAYWGGDIVTFTENPEQGSSPNSQPPSPPLP